MTLAKEMIRSFRTRHYKRVAKKISEALIDQFGSKNLYSAAEVDTVARMVGLSLKQQEIAYALFTEEEACDGFLTKLGSSRTARELRFMMSGYLFGAGSSVGYDGLWNRFHDYDNEVVGGIQSIGSGSSGGSGDDGGNDSGGGFDGGGGDD